jgi:hypothetical protein
VIYLKSLLDIKHVIVSSLKILFDTFACLVHTYIVTGAETLVTSFKLSTLDRN